MDEGIHSAGNAGSAPPTAFEDFLAEWRLDVTEGSPSTRDLGNRFAQKLLMQWFDGADLGQDFIFCDGPGDGGIDAAYLDRAGDSSEGAVGDTWYLVQSKYGSAFRGVNTLLEEGQKVIDTLDGKRPGLSSLGNAVLDRLTTFMQSAGEGDRLVLAFATEGKLDESQARALADLKAMGTSRLGPYFDVEALSVEGVHERLLQESAAQRRLRVTLNGHFAQSGKDLLVGSVPLPELYAFLKRYRAATQDLDQLYERNVRKWLGGRGKINKAIQTTLKDAPELFGLYNNGITIVVSDLDASEAPGRVVLEHPAVVNGCQTTRTLYEVFVARMDAGGKGADAALQSWKERAALGTVVVKVARVGADGEALLQQITRYTNSQNAVREKDFLALTGDFRSWQAALATRRGVYLEVQRGGWDSQRALQRQRPGATQFKRWANAADLMKVYGAGWLGEAGLAFGKNPPFLPGGSVFRRITEPDTHGAEAEPFGADDLYAAMLLSEAAEPQGFGRGAKMQSRRQTRFLFFMTFIELLRDLIVKSGRVVTRAELTRGVLALLERPVGQEGEELVDQALEVVDGYLTTGAENSIFEEPMYLNSYGGDLNAFLKWERLGKTEADCPNYRQLLGTQRAVMGRKAAGQASLRDRARQAIYGS